MNKQKIINSIKQEFMLKRIRAIDECEQYTQSVYKTHKELRELFMRYSKVRIERMKKDYGSNLVELEREKRDLEGKIHHFVEKYNIDLSKFKPKYDCPYCEDTGVYNGKICSCLLNELNKKLSLATSSQTTFKSFNDCNLDIMDETDKKACKLLKDWCNLYPKQSKININILGSAGCGKTFLLECVANEMIKKGNMVCYKTAFELNELARLYHMGKSYEFSDCMDADILIIDDLGTEPVLKNVTKEYLYNLINVRQIKKRPTFISTNLSQNDILSRYDERIYSRLANKNLALNISLTSNDKRINN
ncbi:MAG: ATP-binding protein [Clostridia bacterium]|nr:ATP-binding protein [Clostridia bacterium]